MRIPPLTQNSWAIGHWKILGQYWGTMIRNYFTLQLLSAKRQGEQWTFLFKSKHRPGLHCLSVSFLHTEVSETMGDAVLAPKRCGASRLLQHLGTSLRPLKLCRGDKDAQLDARLQKAALLQLSSSFPTLAALTTVNSSGCKSSSDGCAGPSTTMSSRWPCCEAPALLEGLQWGTLVPCCSLC